jgi:hypothetical protein
VASPAIAPPAAPTTPPTAAPTGPPTAIPTPAPASAPAPAPTASRPCSWFSGAVQTMCRRCDRGRPFGPRRAAAGLLPGLFQIMVRHASDSSSAEAPTARWASDGRR